MNYALHLLVTAALTAGALISVAFNPELVGVDPVIAVLTFLISAICVFIFTFIAWTFVSGIRSIELRGADAFLYGWGVFVTIFVFGAMAYGLYILAPSGRSLGLALSIGMAIAASVSMLLAGLPRLFLNRRQPNADSIEHALFDIGRPQWINKPKDSLTIESQPDDPVAPQAHERRTKISLRV